MNSAEVIYVNLNPKKVALGLGSFAAVMHVIWALAVYLGWAQRFVSFASRLHFIKPMHTFLPFDFSVAMQLVILALVVGSVVGFIFASVWNKVMAKM